MSATLLSGLFVANKSALATYATSCTSATLTGHVLTGSLTSHARFAYSKSRNALVNFGGILTPRVNFYERGEVPIEQSISNLSPNTTYYYQLRVYHGEFPTTDSLIIQSFTTPPCDDNQPPVQTCQDTAATNYGGPLPCTYLQTCQDTSAINYGGTLPCRYENYQQPTVHLRADDTRIDEGDSTTVRWDSNNATSCNASGGTNGWSGSKNTSGVFFTGRLFNSTTFYISCRNTAGSSVNDSVTIIVDDDNDNDNDNVRVDITADDTRIDFEDDTRIRWDSDNADYCVASGGTDDWDDEDIHTSGSFNTGPLDRDETFRITCYNDNDSATDSVTVRVDDDDDDDNNDDEPDVTTRNATNITTSGAKLNGRVDGNGSSTRAWFEYGTNTNLGYSTGETSYGSRSRNYDRNISGLYPNTTYYFRAVAENRDGTDYGNILSFRTTGSFSNIIDNQPTVVIYADQTNLPWNGATFIRWHTTNVNSCFASGGSIGWAGAKNIGPASFYTGSLTSSRTYTITCSNNVGSTTDSVTVNVRGQIIPTSNNVRPPAPQTSLVLITSSLDNNQSINSRLDNARPHPGDEINYTVSYQNIGTASITSLVLRVDLPREVDYIFSNRNNPITSGNTLVFNLGTLRANDRGEVTILVRLQNDAIPGTNLNFPATLSYIDHTGSPQSVTANVSAQVWSEPASVNTDENVSLGANVFGAGFLPTNLLGWLVLFILILLLVLIAKYLLFSGTSFPFRKETVTISESHEDK